LDTDNTFSVAAVILAAGRSTRMGRQKLLLPWGDSTVLGHLIRQWQGLGCRQIGVVCATEDPLVPAELLRVGGAEIIDNPNSSLGMFSSIQCAARWKGWEQTVSHWAIVLGDQPHLRPTTLDNMLRFVAENPQEVCQPKYKERLAHPVFLPKRALVALGETRVATLKDFLAQQEPLGCPCDDPGLAVDIDEPGDYTQARNLAGL
jgi:molybdenum cofactor cytidylyltransferase